MRIIRYLIKLFNRIRYRGRLARQLDGCTYTDAKPTKLTIEDLDDAFEKLKNMKDRQPQFPPFWPVEKTILEQFEEIPKSDGPIGMLPMGFPIFKGLDDDQFIVINPEAFKIKFDGFGRLP